MGKPCWFPWYPNDFLGSSKVTLMTTEEIGAYTLLLNHQWNDPTCSLSAEPLSIQKLTKLESISDLVLSCFTFKRGRLRNMRLYREWKKSKYHQQVKRQNARKRWDAIASATALQAQMQKQCSPQSQSQSQSEEEKKEKNLCPDAHNGRNYRAEAKLVLQFLNEKTGRHYREVSANLAFIEARLKSGVDVQTCKTLIARKVRDWTPNPEMLPYLRPETLFNKTKFETYLAEVSP